MLITSKNYGNQMEMINSKLHFINLKIFKMIERYRIDKVNFIALGNSISTGFSMCDAIIPFAMRNSDLYDNKELIRSYSFARPILNSEENVINWYLDNISHEEINKLVCQDIIMHENQCNKEHWSRDIFNRFSEIGSQNLVGLKDLNETANFNNIIVYNGCTGTFVESIARGELKDKLTILTSFKRDLKDLNVLLKLIYVGNNRSQVYVCGLPNIMNTNIVKLINNAMKNICSKFPNVIFVEGASRNILYNSKGQGIGDVHHNQPEYLQLHYNIMEKVSENYLIVEFITVVIFKIRELSKFVESNDRSLKEDSSFIYQIIKETVEKYAPLFQKSDQSLDLAISKIQDYYSINYLNDYYFTSKGKTIKLLEMFKKNS